MDRTKPLPCPFCGCEYTKDEDDFVYAGQHEDWCPLNVKNNGLENLVVEDDPKAIEMWNRRKPDGHKILEVLYRMRNEMRNKKRSGINFLLNLEGLDHLLLRIAEHHDKF